MEPTRMVRNEKTILLVEDDQDYRKMIKLMLYEEGHDIKEASNGEQALELLLYTDYRPDLILLDQMMPLMDGNEFLEKIRENPHTNSIKVAFLSGKNSLKCITDAMDKGANYYLLKNQSRYILVDKMKRIIDDIEKTDGNCLLIHEVTNILHNFSVIDYTDKTLMIKSSEEVPTGSIVTLLAKQESHHHHIRSVNGVYKIEECSIKDDHVLIKCQKIHISDAGGN